MIEQRFPVLDDLYLFVGNGRSTPGDIQFIRDDGDKREFFYLSASEAIKVARVLLDAAEYVMREGNE